MNAVELALRHGRGLVFVAVVAAGAGIFVSAGLPKGVYPEVVFHREQVVASQPGAPASAVLTSLTRPLEATLASLPGVEHLRSRTIRGACEISISV